MPLIAAMLFVCASPVAVDGDSLRCAEQGAVRLMGIDAPELPGHCRTGRVCTPGDPFASRAALAGMVSGRVVRCRSRKRDTFGRLLARCTAEGAGDLSCAMLARGFAVRRYARVECGR